MPGVSGNLFLKKANLVANVPACRNPRAPPMKSRRISSSVFLIIAAAATIGAARADDSDTLTAAPWKISYEKGWALVRIFDHDGRFGSPGRPDQTGRWKISGNMVVQTFADGRKDIFNLPLDPKGAAGIAKDGEAMTAVQDSTLPATLPVPGAGITQAQRDATVPLLVSGPWKITGRDYFRVRVFGRDGKFTTQGNGDEHGQWKLTGDMVTLSFQNNYKDFLFLPLDSKATAGADASGAPVTAALVNNATNTGASHGLSPLLDSSEPPAPMTEDEKNALATTLTSGAWKISSNTGSWTDIHIFDKNGTFTTVSRAELHGHWKISGNKLILNFVGGQKHSVQLPLNPQGTPGVTEHGEAFTFSPANPK
jgi:hypothetical protein